MPKKIPPVTKNRAKNMQARSPVTTNNVISIEETIVFLDLSFTVLYTFLIFIPVSWFSCLRQVNHPDKILSEQLPI